MVDKKDSLLIGKIFGILSIVFAFIQPIGGIIFGIIGLSQIKEEKKSDSKKIRKLNIIGIVLGGILLIASIVIAYFFQDYLTQFPTQ